jgi:hypothetical protein
VSSNSNDQFDQASILSTTRTLFSFLEGKGRRVLVEPRTGQTTVAYISDPLTFEVELDWRERAAFLLVAQTIGGHRPPGYYVHLDKRVRLHLMDALRRSNSLSAKTEKRLKEVMSGSGEQAMLTQVRLFSDELRKNLKPLLASTATLFTEERGRS